MTLLSRNTTMRKMKYRVTTLSLLLFFLSACGHLRSSPDKPSTLHHQPDAINTVTEAATPVDIIKANDTTPQMASETQQAMVAETDLLDRIRAGFKFPDFQSRHIHQYERWNSRHPTYLKNLFQRAEPFLFHIVEEIERRGLPMELALLPAIESAFNPNAISRSSAGGLWQFMPATGRSYGLRQGWWYDGRRDAIAATEAALNYLTTLNKLFNGDWLLTLAAYNAGPGTIQRAMRSNKRRKRGTNYQDLALRSETERYVPKLFALKNIIENPQKLDVKLPFIANQPHFKVFDLPGQINLHRFAEEADIELAALQHLNAGFTRWATAPEGPHRLLVPLQTMSKVVETLENLSANPPVQYRHHPIRKGDTLSGIAQHYGVSVGALKSANRLSSSSIRAGRSLIVPKADSTIEQNLATLALLKQPNKASNSDLMKKTPTQAEDANAEPNRLIHHVVVGDTLWSIAQRYEVQVSQLRFWNKLSDKQILRLDQVLQILPKN